MKNEYLEPVLFIENEQERQTVVRKLYNSCCSPNITSAKHVRTAFL